MEKKRKIQDELEATISRCRMKIQNDDDRRKDIEKAKAAEEGFDFLTNLPESIVDQIFLRVPSKDLARSAKYVSKNWFSLITCPLFIFSKLQLEWPPLSLNSNCFSSPQLLRIFQNGETLDFCLQKPDLEKETQSLEWKTSNLITFKGSLITIITRTRAYEFDFEVSCLNGLICFYNYSRSVYISNPLTGEFFTAPKTALPHHIDCFDIIAYGFGFCPLLNKYKIVHICCCQCLHSQRLPPPMSQHRLNTLRGEVCTVGLDTSWRKVHRSQGPRYPHLPHEKALVIENFMYWLPDSHVAPEHHSINFDKQYDDCVTPLVTFDITSEAFGEILVPIPSQYIFDAVKLIELEGKLCIVKENPNMTSFWLPKDMTKLEEAGNWFIKYQFNFFIPDHLGYVLKVPVGIIAKDVFVMRLDEEHMLYYNFQTGKFLGFDVIYFPTHAFRSVPIPYVPSLVSIVSP